MPPIAGVFVHRQGEDSGVGSFGGLPQDLLQAFLGAIAASVVAAGSGFLITRIPRVREWFVVGGPVAQLLTMFLMSVIVAGAMGLFLRNLTWQEVNPLKQALAGFSIVAGGRVDSAANQSCEGQITDDFRARKEIGSIYVVCLKNPVAQDSVIITNSTPSDADKPTDIVISRVISTFHNSFKVQTLVNGSATDRGFWFLVFRQDTSR